MKFRTEVLLQNSDKKIVTDSKIFTIGSCFATEMANLLQKAQLQVFCNPFGTIFNPYSVNLALKRIHRCEYYSEEDLVAYGGHFISLDHHSSFSQDYQHLVLEKINTEIDGASQFLQHTDFVIITFGTSFVHYFLPKEKLVANCHKIPGKFFEKRYLSHLEIVNSIYETVQVLKDICKKDVRILFTISPVRHIRDGIPENMLSKAKLIAAVHEIMENFDYCHYLPIYEIMMDDLRDYRFYKDDMLHPNSQAINYIFEKFSLSYFSDEVMDFVEENLRIWQALQHRPTNKGSAGYLQFKQKINERIEAQQKKVKHKIFS